MQFGKYEVPNLLLSSLIVNLICKQLNEFEIPSPVMNTEQLVISKNNLWDMSELKIYLHRTVLIEILFHQSGGGSGQYSRNLEMKKMGRQHNKLNIFICEATKTYH